MAARYRTLAAAGASALVVAVAPVLASCRMESPDRSEAEDRARRTGYRGFVVEDAPPKPEFVLSDTDGRPFAFAAETDGYLALLFFGYTHCPDVCPVQMGGIAAVRRELPLSVQRRMKVVFVTTDPERDTPGRLRSWLQGFDPSFIGLRGTKEEVDSIQVKLGLPPSVRGTSAEGGYVVGHASAVIAFSPDGRLRVTYPFGTRQADWKHDLLKLAGDG